MHVEIILFCDDNICCLFFSIPNSEFRNVLFGMYIVGAFLVGKAKNLVKEIQLVIVSSFFVTDSYLS